MRMPSIQTYLIIDTQLRSVHVHSRTDDGRLALDVFRGADTLALPEVGLEMSLDELYRGTSDVDSKADG